MPMTARLTATALTLVLGAVPAFADVTPRQVWDSWQSSYAEMGMTLTPASETEADGALTMRDVAISMEDPDEGLTLSGTIAQITLRDLGDGTVSITQSPDYGMKLDLAPPEAARVTADIAVSMPDLETIASGTAPALSYKMTGPEATFSANLADDEGTVVNANVALGAIAGTYVTQDTAQTFEYDLTADTMGMTLNVVPGPDADAESDAPDTGGETVDLDWRVEDLRTDGSGDLAVLSPGFDMFGDAAGDAAATYGLAYGAQVLTVRVTDPESGEFLLNSTASSGSLNVALADGHVEYDTNTDDILFDVSGDNVPLPDLSATMANLGLTLNMPVAQTETPEDFALNLNLDGLSVSDTLWSMVDPQGALPRDPASLLIDLAGKVRLLTDLGDPAPADPEQAPGEVHALDLKSLALSAVGARLNAAGSFTFDNADTVTFNGMPAPDGAVDLELIGGNALLDKLVAMGLLPQDQAMGARMMLGLFSTPTGDDTLTTKIEVRPDGSISANGQRLK